MQIGAERIPKRQPPNLRVPWRDAAVQQRADLWIEIYCEWVGGLQRKWVDLHLLKVGVEGCRHRTARLGRVLNPKDKNYPLLP